MPPFSSNKLERTRWSLQSLSVKGKLVSLVLCISFCLFFQPVRRYISTVPDMMKSATSPTESTVQGDDELNSATTLASVHGLLDTSTGKGSKRERLPTVHRAILQKMDHFLERDEFEPHTLAVPQRSGKWPPTISHIPEPKPTRVTSGSGTSRVDLCQTDTQPRLCRFLLPLRISEQESKARIHFLQLLQLARALNRTLVLPNVGKSRIGACYRWNFETYYDIVSLKNEGYDLVTLEVFKGWTEGSHARSQLVSIAPKAPTHLRYHNATAYRNQHAEARAFASQDIDLPGCFHTKFRNLRLQKWPISVSMLPKVNAETSDSPSLGQSIIDVLLHYEISPDAAAVEPYNNFQFHTSDSIFPREISVLAIDWDLRHVIFPSSSSSPTLRYSPQLTALAEQLAPTGPYLVIHWRMETMDPEFLPDCAHALVDTLSNILEDELIASGIQTVWLASDYPFPIARSIQRAREFKHVGNIPKSGTFRDFGKRHEEAIEILTNAFQGTRELSSWRLTELRENIGWAKGDDVDELLQDSGALGILDKLISMRATLFVSGGKRCSRTRSVFSQYSGQLKLKRSSSFTKQVVEARREMWTKESAQLGNIIDTFG